MMRLKNGVIFTLVKDAPRRMGWYRGDRRWGLSLYYGPVLLARFDEREMRFMADRHIAVGPEHDASI